MTETPPQGVRRWVLHPIGPSLALAGVALFAGVAAVRDVPAAGALLACAAGCAAGFANSGST